MGEIAKVLSYARSRPWAIEESYGLTIRDVLLRRASGERLGKRAMAEAIGEGQERLAAHLHAAEALEGQAGGAIAVLPLVGTLMNRASVMSETSGVLSTQAFVRQFRALERRPDVRAIVLDVDSPGGAVDGAQEAADVVWNSEKTVVAVANAVSASAAYWIASQADEFVASPSALVGAIGILSFHVDESEALAQEGIKVTVFRAGRFKGEANPFEPLTDEASAAWQGLLDSAYSDFTRTVARARGVTPAAVRGGFGEGRVVTAKEAVSIGMADRVATLEETVVRLMAGGRVKKSPRSAEVLVESSCGRADTTSSGQPLVAAAVAPAGAEPDDDLDVLERELELTAKQGTRLPRDA